MLHSHLVLSAARCLCAAPGPHPNVAYLSKPPQWWAVDGVKVTPAKGSALAAVPIHWPGHGGRSLPWVQNPAWRVGWVRPPPPAIPTNPIGSTPHRARDLGFSRGEVCHAVSFVFWWAHPLLAALWCLLGTKKAITAPPPRPAGGWHRSSGPRCQTPRWSGGAAPRCSPSTTTAPSPRQPSGEWMWMGGRNPINGLDRAAEPSDGLGNAVDHQMTARALRSRTRDVACVVPCDFSK